MMSAFGELITLLIYAVLALPPIIMLIIILLNGKKFLKKGIIYLFLTSIPLMWVLMLAISKQKNEAHAYIGVYYLTEYSDCTSCTLELKENNTYIVTKGANEVEQGAWNYRSGSDYWIVDIGKHGQLGAGKYKYYHKKEAKD